MITQLYVLFLVINSDWWIVAGFSFPENNACMQIATVEFTKLAHEKK